MNNQYLPKYVKVKKVTRPDGRPCFLEKDHVNPVEDTLLFEDTQFGNLVEPAGSDLVTILRHISDGSASTECKIKSISKNGTTLPIDEEKNVDIEVPTQLSQLAEDTDHTTLTAEQKSSIANKVDKSTTIAGLDLQDNITKAEMLTALDNPQNNVLESVTINGNTPIISGKNQTFTVLSSSPFPSSFVDGINPLSDTVTTLQFCNSIQNTASAIAGMTYLGRVHLSDMPFPGGAGEVIVRIMTNAKVIVLELFSGDIECKHWYAMYYDNAMHTGDSTCPWQGIMSVNGDNNRGYTPTGNYQAAPKKYVDDSIKINSIKFNDDVLVPVNKQVIIEEEDPVFTNWKNSKGIAIGKDAVNSVSVPGTTTNSIAIGNEATTFQGESIAIGPYSVAQNPGSVQISEGTNSDNNSLQFRNTKIVNSDGKIPTVSLEFDPSTKVDKSTTIAGIDLQDNITKSELQNAIDFNTKVDKNQKIVDITLQGDITKQQLLNALNVEDGAQKNSVEFVNFNYPDKDKRIVISSLIADNSENKVYGEYRLNNDQWTQSDKTNGDARSVTYGNRKFISAINGGGGLWSSNNGINWTQVVGAVSMFTVCYGNGRFVAGSYNNGIWYSTDGNSWSTANNTGGIYWKSSVFSEEKSLFVFLSVDKGIWNSNDGITWTSVKENFVGSSVTYGNGKFVAACNNNGLWYSTDGITWDKVNTSYMQSANCYSLTYGNGKFIAATETGGIWYSGDGLNWNQSNNKTLKASGLAYGKGKFIATVRNNGGIWYSVNGIDWSQSDKTDGSWLSASYGNGLFICCNETSGLWYHGMAKKELVNIDQLNSKVECDPVFTDWKNGKTITAGENTEGTEGCIAIGLGAKTEDWGTAVGVNSFARCGLALGPDAKAGSSGDSENLAAIAIGRYSQATKKNSISIGGNDPTHTAKTNAVGAVQIGIGTNNDENSLQFQNTKIVVNGKIPTTSLEFNPDDKADKSTTIAGIDLQDNITKAELLNALNVEDGAKANKIEIVKVNGTPQEISKTDKSVDIIVDAPTEANNDEITAATETGKYISPNKNKFATMTGLLKNADDESLSEANQQKLQNWLGTNELVFTFSDNTTKTFKFVCSEV